MTLSDFYIDFHVSHAKKPYKKFKEKVIHDTPNTNQNEKNLFNVTNYTISGVKINGS